MNFIPTAFGLFLLFSLCVPCAIAETVKDREGAVRGDKAKMAESTRWIYNDIDAGFERAKASGQPLMVVLRCVPCLSCMGIDTGVLIENPKLSPLLDQFVRVRVINANKLDLERFQFDYDLSFSTLFFNADGTLYARFGSWEHQKDPENKVTASFAAALEGVLRAHRGYPANQDRLAGKQGKPTRFKRPTDMPGIKGKYKAELNWSGKVVQSCVHCHQLGDSKRFELRELQGKPLPLDLIYPHPPPSVLGLTLDTTAFPLKISAVAEGSPAANAGAKQGDLLLAIGAPDEAQLTVSDADVTWALHHLPDAGGPVAAVVYRGEERKTLTMNLAADWRSKVDISRRVGTWPMRAMAFGGMKLDELDAGKRRELDLDDKQFGLFAKHVGQYGKHAKAKQAGWRKGDILLDIDGDDSRLSESQLIGKLIREHEKGDKVPVAVLRNGKRIRLSIPVQ